MKFKESEYLGEGGEGRCYVRGGRVYKIYHNKADLNRGKLLELMTLDDDRILRPLEVFEDGYCMRYVSGDPLARLVGADYQARMNVPVRSVVDQLFEGLRFVHSRNCLVVDGNDMNYIVSNNEVFFIDVDSYQTPNYPASAYTESLRDWKISGFDRLSDWFTMACVTFSLWVGVHPYKGTHPKYGRNVKDRIIHGASVFDKGVSLPPSCRSFDLIPSDLRGWYERVFRGERIEYTKKINKIDQIDQIDDSTGSFKGHTVQYDHNHIIVDQKYKIMCERSIIIDDRLYVFVGERMNEIDIRMDKIIIVRSYPILPYAVSLFPGCVVMHKFGRVFVFKKHWAYLCEGRVVRYENGGFIIEHKGLRSFVPLIS
jgi:hypothetical protein